MKNKLFPCFVFVLLLPWLLAGCSAGNGVTSDSTAPAGEQNLPSSDPILPCSASSQAGYYHIGIYYGPGASICYLDYETMQDVVLCASPNCTHDSDTCPAFYPFEERTLLGGVQLAGDTLLALQTVPGETTVSHIDRLSLDGSYEGCLAEFGANQQLPGNIETDYYTDGSFLYFVLYDVDPETTQRSGRVVSVSLESGEVNTVYESPEGASQLSLFTSFDRSLVLYEIQGEKISSLAERFFVLNVDTGTEEDLDWRSGDTTATMAKGPYLWTVDESAQTLVRSNLEDGTAQQYSLEALCGQVQEKYGDILELYISPLSFTDEACFVEFSVPDQDGNCHSIFYTFQLSDSSFTPFDLRMTFNETILPVFAQTPFGLLVQKDWVPVSRDDGELYLPQWGLISLENYLRSNPEWIGTGQLDLNS